jgi:hypothetical protein
MKDACEFSAFCLLPFAFYARFCENCIRSVKIGEAQKGRRLARFCRERTPCRSVRADGPPIGDRRNGTESVPYRR